MRTLLTVVGVLAVVLPLLTGPPAAAQEQAQVQRDATGNPVGALGPVNALGQEVKRPSPPTGPPPRLPDGTIDLGDGAWVLVPGGGDSIAQRLNGGGELPLLPAAKALMASRQPTDDPVNWCLPLGLLRTSPYPFRFIQNYTHKKPTHMYIMSEWMGSFRQVFLDGRKHPADLEPTWFGHSIGWYEKDSLVIDTVGFNEKAWYNGRGMPRTQRLHTVERWTRRDAGHMATEVLIDDPGTFSRPFSVKFESVLAQPGDELMEYVCQENNQYGVASGVR